MSHTGVDMLHFDGTRRFDTPGPIPDGIVDAFDESIAMVSASVTSSAFMVMHSFQATM